jgi:hypothetical protein
MESEGHPRHDINDYIKETMVTVQREGFPHLGRNGGSAQRARRHRG